jgi:hypothetical protein
MHETQHRRGTPGAADSVRRLVDQTFAAWEPAFTLLDDAWSGWAGAAGDMAATSHRGRPFRHIGHGWHHVRCGCRCDDGHRRHDRCDHCDCCSCASGADVLIEAHIGERRVVPLTLHNRRRRTTTVTLRPGEWTSCTEDAPEVATEVVPGGEVTLEPCVTRVVRLVVSVGATQSKEEVQRLGDDVRCCTVVVSDLRVDGCGTTVRLAVAVLPSDCGAVVVDCCGCGC